MRTQPVWVIKASKFCNLRCSYCYEWDELGKRERISQELWRRIFVAVRDYHEFSDRTEGHGNTRSLVVLHGGEPLTLPLTYLQSVMGIRRDVLGSDLAAFPLALQTNAYRVSEQALAFIADNGITIGVSYDHVPGARLSITGRGTEAAVEANLERLRRHCLVAGGIVVLAKHTAPRVCEIYDWYAAKNLSFRILPLFEGPETRPEGFELSNDELAHSLSVLFDHWISSGARIRIDPFQQYLGTVAAKILGFGPGRRQMDRALDRSQVFAVNTNGTLYHVPEALEPEKAIGNLNAEAIMDVLAGKPYLRSVERDRERLSRHCGHCEFAGSCSGLPLLQSWQSGPYSGRCPVTYNVLEFMEAYIRAQGFDAEDLQSLADVGRVPVRIEGQVM